MINKEKEALINISVLNTFFEYNPTSGKIFNKFRDENYFLNVFGRSKKSTKMFNNSFAGKEAGAKTNTGYRGVNISIGGKYYGFLCHRIAWCMFYGEYPCKDIDHIDRNKLNNKICNLREVNQSENALNMSKPKSGFNKCKGVCWKKDKNKYKAYVMLNYKQKHLGYYKDEFEAFCARLSWENKNKYTINPLQKRFT